MTTTHGEEAKVEKGEGKEEMKTGEIFKKLEFKGEERWKQVKFSRSWNSIIKGGEEMKEEREEDLFVQFDKYEKF